MYNFNKIKTVQQLIFLVALLMVLVAINKGYAAIFTNCRDDLNGGKICTNIDTGNSPNDHGGVSMTNIDNNGNSVTIGDTDRGLNNDNN